MSGVRAMRAAVALVAIGCVPVAVEPLRVPATVDTSAVAREAAPVASDAGSLLSPVRIARLPAPQREAWQRYLVVSQEQRALDRSAMAAELRALPRERMTRAPYARGAFALDDDMPDEWFRGDTARRIADIILTFQTPSGGWSKNVDMTVRPRQPGESYYSESDGWHYIATIDNEATSSQLRFLARAYAAQGEDRWREAFRSAVAYLRRARFPNGCWPQVYPLQGSYHDAVTFNDNAIVNVLQLLQDMVDGTLGSLPEADARPLRDDLSAGVDCVLASQVVVDGRRTVWAQQHDPLTLAPVPARSYEPASLSGRESAGIMRFLMSLPAPDARVVEAVHAAAAWFRTAAIHGWRYDFETGLHAESGADPIWARMYEIGTDRPIFSNRDGIVLYDWHELTDRRQGYAWYTTEPAGALRQYERWARRHPRSGAGAPASGAASPTDHSIDP